MKIVVKKGLDIPLEGKPEGEISSLPNPKLVALNLDPFDAMRFKVHVKVGDRVKIGQPLVESKSMAGVMFASPAAGVVKEVRRGLKRRLLDVVIEVEGEETYQEFGPLKGGGREQIIERFKEAGLFPHIRMRPFDMVANPEIVPRDIFVRAIESLPFVPSAEQQVEGHEAYFQEGLETLKKLTDGDVHLVYREDSTVFAKMAGVEKHTARGPHPVATSSLHIQKIASIRSAEDWVWTLSTVDVITIGKMMREGRYFTDRVVGIGGSGVVEGRTGFFHTRAGAPIVDLIADRLSNQAVQLVSGDPLTGTLVEPHDFLGFYDKAFSVIPENIHRQPFHFFRPGFDKYTATKAYFTGHVKPPKSGFTFTTNQHGEERAFIDGAVYEKIMPLKIPTMHLVKSVIGEDFETAEQLGLLEVAPEDFALPTFICPSKIEMIQIIKAGLHAYAQEMGH